MWPPEQSLPPAYTSPDFNVGSPEPFAFVPVECEGCDYPEEYRGRVMIDTIHDGTWIPPQFLSNPIGVPFDRTFVSDRYIQERDWGANLVAHSIAQNLGLAGYFRVDIARVLLDFGRFPGSTARGADHLHRFAINYPFSELLDYQQKVSVLEGTYDRISREMDRAVTGSLLKIAVHTYDARNASGTVRPNVSLVTQPIGYQANSEMPVGVFDPLYPDILAEFTCDRILRDRIALNLERSGVPVAHNYPYLLPEGSTEVRSQVWFFFDYLRNRFEQAHPDTGTNSSFEMVWNMLMDTNLRSSESETLRSYLHLYRRPPAGFERDFQCAGEAYEVVRAFLAADSSIVDDYRFSPLRPSSIGVEVRKDLVWDLDDHGRPIAPRTEDAFRLGKLIAEAVAIYLREDRRFRYEARSDFARADPWYTQPNPAR